MARKIAKRHAALVLGVGGAVAALVAGCGELLVLDADPLPADGGANVVDVALDGAADEGGDADEDDGSGRCRGAFDEPAVLQYPTLADANDQFPRFRGGDEGQLFFHSDRPSGGRSKLYVATKTGPDTYTNAVEVADAAIFGASSAVEPFVEGDFAFFSLVGDNASSLVRLEVQASGNPPPVAIGVERADYNRAPFLAPTELFFAAYKSIENSKIYRVARSGDGGTSFGSTEEVALHDGVAVGTPVLSKNGKTLFYSYGFDLDARVYLAKRQADGRFEDRQEAIARSGVMPSSLTDDDCRLFVTMFVDGKWRLGVANRRPR